VTGGIGSCSWSCYEIVCAEKDDALEKKSKQLACLQMDRKRLETELSQVSDQTSSSDRQLGLLKRKVKVIRILITFQKHILYSGGRFELWSSDTLGFQ